MPLYLVPDLVARGDKNALLVQEHFGNRYDDHYMEMKSDRQDDYDHGDKDEPVVIDEDAPGERRTKQILCITVGFLGVRAYPSACDVIVVNGDVFVAGQEEYHKCFLPWV